MYSDISVQRQYDAKSLKSSLAKTPDTRFLRFANQCDDKLDSDDKNESEEENSDDIDDAMSQLLDSVSENDEIVLDIRYLLNRLIWEKESTFKEIVSQYVHYVESYYGQYTVVFDGYCENASTKDRKHKRRLLKAQGTPNMSDK